MFLLNVLQDIQRVNSVIGAWQRTIKEVVHEGPERPPVNHSRLHVFNKKRVEIGGFERFHLLLDKARAKRIAASDFKNAV